ncbi:MAG: FixH family protein [Pseudomonadota bacterium]
MQPEFRITGKHVLAMLIGFFLVIIAVNMVFLNVAMKTFPGEKEEKSYLQGMNYNERLAVRAEQASLGWTASIEKASLTDGEVRLAIKIQASNGLPVAGLDVKGLLARPVNATNDLVLTFTEEGNGTYVAAGPASAGVWDLEGKASENNGTVFEFTSRLVLK